MYSIREIISIISFIALAGLFWFALTGVLGLAPRSLGEVGLAASFILLAAAGTVSAVLLRAFSSFIVSFIGAAALFLIFFGTNLPNAAAVVFSGLFLSLAFRELKTGESDSLKISFSRLVKIFLPRFLTAIFILSSLAFYSSPAASKGTEFLLPKSLFDASLKFLQEPLAGFLPFKMSPDMTADEFVLLYAITGLAKEGGVLPIKFSSELLAAAK
ncbi:MAG: hypothetical protein AAB851_00180, partial [Patescibacteria group bacterium]